MQYNFILKSLECYYFYGLLADYALITKVRLRYSNRSRILIKQSVLEHNLDFASVISSIIG